MATGTGAEYVVSRIRREMRLGFTVKFAFEAEPCLVLAAAFGNITGEEAIHSEDHQPQSDDVKSNGDHRQSLVYVTQHAENGTEEEEDQFTDEQRVVETVCTVPSIQKTSEFFTKFHSGSFISWHSPA